MYLLDSNACIMYLNHVNSPVRERFNVHGPNEVALCSIVKAELMYGARHSQNVEKNLASLRKFFAAFASLPFDDPCAEEAARIRADLAAQGRPIGPHDVMIAAIARAHDAVLVTHNTGEFSRVTGLRIEDWER